MRFLKGTRRLANSLSVLDCFGRTSTDTSFPQISTDKHNRHCCIGRTSSIPDSLAFVTTPQTLAKAELNERPPKRVPKGHPRVVLGARRGISLVGSGEALGLSLNSNLARAGAYAYYVPNKELHRARTVTDWRSTAPDSS